MSVELEVKVSHQTTNSEIENCIRETIQHLFSADESKRLVFDTSPKGSDSQVSNVVIRLDDVAAVSAEFFDFDHDGCEEGGLWCTLSANMDRNKITYALMCIIAVALADQFKTSVVDDSLWLGTTREISSTELKNRIRDHSGQELRAAAGDMCRSLGIGG